MANIRTRDTASGPRYDVKFKFNGRHRMKTFRTFDDAKAYKKEVEGDELAGLVMDPKGGERVFETYADAWLEQRPVRGRPLTPATRQGHRAVLRRHLNPEFGSTNFARSPPSESVRGRQPTAAPPAIRAAKSYGVLRAILNTAVSGALISRNPCSIRGAGIEHARGERPCSRRRPSWSSPSRSERDSAASCCSEALPGSARENCSDCSDATSTCVMAQ